MRHTNALATAAPDTGRIPTRNRIHTRFGEFEFDDSEVVCFPHGVPGFEACRRFVLIMSEDLQPLSCLQAIDAPHPSFLLVDPAEVYPGYRGDLTPADRAALGLESEDKTSLVWLVIVNVEPENVSANLKAPIVINPSRMLGCQVLQNQVSYPVDWPMRRS